VNKKQLDQRIAAVTNYSTQEVAAITSTFLRLIVHDLLRGERVYLPTLGKFRMKGEVTALRVSFSRSKNFKKNLQEHLGQHGARPMQKYGVDETTGQDQEKLEKRAAQGCPMCGGKVERQGNLLICSSCGTQPFEGIPGTGSK